jgi:hypothetical protein
VITLASGTLMARRTPAARQAPDTGRGSVIKIAIMPTATVTRDTRDWLALWATVIASILALAASEPYFAHGLTYVLT